MNKITDQEKVEIYTFLKVVFATEPSPELLKFLQTPQVIESLKASGVCLEKEDLALSRLKKLQADYAQLFIGPRKHIALNESIYTEKTPQFWGKGTVKINKLIEQLNLELDKNWTGMPDHISVEFELMQKLLEAKIKASKANNHQTVVQCTKAISILFEEHIIKWVPQVCLQVIERAQTSCYKAIGTWTKVFIEYY